MTFFKRMLSVNVLGNSLMGVALKYVYVSA